MGPLLIRRLISLVFVLLGMSLITFTISHVIPADPAAAAAGLHGSAEQIETIRKNMGLDKPLWEQYLTYMENLVLRGDMGRSIAGNSSVRDDLTRFLPASLELAMFAILLFLPTGIVLGVLSARKAGGWVDAGTRGFAILGMSIPVFWLGVMMQIVFFGWLNILPPTGRISSSFGPPPHFTGFYTVDALLAGNLPMFGDAVEHIIMPAVVLALGSLAVVTRMTRSSVLEVMGHDYVRTARSKGLAENVVLYRHVLRNAMIPIVTIVALQMAGLIAWQFLVETIFSWPGIGSWAVQSILTLDFQVIMAVTLFGAVIYVGLNFIADLMYIWLDPRIRI